jgi:hypothetical protein
MNGSDIGILVVSKYAEQELTDVADRTERARKAFKQGLQNGMVIEPDTVFRGCVMAYMGSYPEGAPERESALYEVRMLRKLSMLLSGAQAGISFTFNDEDEEKPDLEPIGLMKLFHEARGAS